MMAKDAGLQMPHAALLEGKSGRYFACKRFDRRGESAYALCGCIDT